MDSLETFNKKMQQKVEQWKSEIDSIKYAAKTSSSNQQQIKELIELQESAYQKLAELHETSGDSWRDLHKETQKDWQELERKITKAIKTLK